MKSEDDQRVYEGPKKKKSLLPHEVSRDVSE